MLIIKYLYTVKSKFSQNNVINVTTWLHATSLWDRLNPNSLEQFDLRWFHDPSIVAFEVVDKSHLTWLTYALFIGEATGTKQHGTILNIIEKAYIKKETCASSTSSSFARITVNRYNVFWVLLQPFVHLVDEMKENMERRRVMVFPTEVGHSIVKPGGIICPLTYVKNVIFVRMFLIHEFLNLKSINVIGYKFQNIVVK